MPKHKHPHQTTIRTTMLTLEDREFIARREARRRGEVYVPPSAKEKESFTCIENINSLPSESLCRSMAHAYGFEFNGRACQGECQAKRFLIDRTRQTRDWSDIFH